VTIADIDWPGPRPLTFEDEAASDIVRKLVGRDRELRELVDVCQTYAVIEITAPSGVGKTSFVAGAKPYLEEAGARVEKARPWSETLQEYDRARGNPNAPDDPRALYYLAFGEAPAGDGDPRELLERLSAGQSLVCIIDQLEELLRYRAPLGRALLQLVGRTAGATGVAHIVIARSEFRNHLRPVEVRNAPTWHMLLNELADPGVIRQVITRPVPDDVTVEEEAVDRLVAWWTSSRSATTGFRDADGVWQETFVQPGLLQLQALLWSLQRWAAAAPTVDPRRLTLTDVEEFARAQQLDAGPDSGAALMDVAMLDYIKATIEDCTSPRWPIGPRLMVARAARHLSSAGYKVPQAASSLVPLALQEELSSSKAARDLSQRLRTAGADAESRLAVAEAFPIEGAGLAASWEWPDVTNEMITSLESGLDRLANERDANVLRKFQHGGDPVYELVHDGVGAALNRWAETLLDDPVATISVISAQRGQVMAHHLRPETFADDAGFSGQWSAVRLEERDGRTVAIIDGLKWIGLGVHLASPWENPDRLQLERLVFRDCTFQGSVFINVTFRDVVFDTSNLQGVAMLGCAFERVRFEGAPEAGLDSLAIKRAKPRAEVEFRALPKTTGLFLTDLAGGAWSFVDVSIEHLALTSGPEQLHLRFAGNSVVSHATFSAPASAATVDVEAGVTIDPRTDEHSILPELR
jgi:hypothetical protein